jgi:glyoxylase-like metal-dependent hydrolase (beta-lactamase superfamily II)
VTHIHLDHAGGAGPSRAGTERDAVVHERGAPHLADPAKPVASTARLHGEERMRRFSNRGTCSGGSLTAISDGDRSDRELVFARPPRLPYVCV